MLHVDNLKVRVELVYFLFGSWVFLLARILDWLFEFRKISNVQLRESESW